MFVTRAHIQFFDTSTPHLCCHFLVEEFQKGRISAGKIISKGLALLVIQRELDLQSSSFA